MNEFRKGQGFAAWPRLLVGLAAFSTGIVMTLWADLGLPPWDVLHDGLRKTTPLTFGMAAIAVGVFLVVACLFAGIRPGPGTLANMILVGVFIDLLIATQLGAGVGDEVLVWRILMLVGGIATMGIGSALYIGAQLGTGPRDSLMVAIATKLRVRVGVARAVVEGSALLTGWLLGGTVGIGTAVFAVTIGPAVDVAFSLFRMDSAGRPRARTAEGVR